MKKKILLILFVLCFSVSCSNSFYEELESFLNNNSSKCISNCTVNVKGYYRKDGTYVRPHTRSAPRSRK